MNMDMEKNSWLGLGVSAGRAAGKVWLLRTFTSELECVQEGETDA